MAAAISNRLVSQGMNNWYVEAYCWTNEAHTVQPDSAVNKGKALGARLGRQLAGQAWSHIHLIGHSAGSALIQLAAENIKTAAPSTVVHTTFLDPFVGFTTVGLSYYGDKSDWADSYFADDWTGYLTAGQLAHAHNVDVTALDPASSNQLLCFDSSLSAADSTPAGVVPSSSHGWPYGFYAATIPTNTLAGADGYGFPLSKEGGGWDNRANYPANNPPVVLGGTTCLPSSSLEMNSGAAFDFANLPLLTSTNGAQVMSGGMFTLSSTQSSTSQSAAWNSAVTGIANLDDQAQTTVWLSSAVTVTSPVNFVACDVAFTSPTGAEGLLTVYWNTNMVGSVDERAVSAGSQTWRFPLPSGVSTGVFAVGFRLDSFTNVASSVTVTNVVVGYAGTLEPFTLNACGATNGMFMMLSGPSNNNYLVQVSTNLADWSPFAVLVNTNGAVRFFDPGMSNCAHRYYRAVLP